MMRRLFPLQGAPGLHRMKVVPPREIEVGNGARWSFRHRGNSARALTQAVRVEPRQSMRIIILVVSMIVTLQFTGGARAGASAGSYGMACGCPADLDLTGEVNAADIGVLLGSYGMPGVGDLNEDGIVDGADLGMLLADFGPCPFECAQYGDVVESYSFEGIGLPPGDAAVSIFVDDEGVPLGSFTMLIDGLDSVIGDFGESELVIIVNGVWIRFLADPLDQAVTVDGEATTIEAMLGLLAEDLLASLPVESWHNESVAMACLGALSDSQAFACNCGAALAETELYAIARWRKLVTSAVCARVIGSAAGLGCGWMKACEQGCYAGRIAIPCAAMQSACFDENFLGAATVLGAVDALWQDD